MPGVEQRLGRPWLGAGIPAWPALGGSGHRLPDFVLLDRILGSAFEGLWLRLCSSPSLSVLTFSRGTRVYGPELTRQAESCVILTSALSGSQSTTRRSECPQRPADPGGRHLGRAWPGEAGLTSSHPQL